MIDDLEHTMERIGRILTADSTLRVEVRGDAAFAEPGRVVLPAIDRYEHLGTENAYRLLHGLVDHECGHAADSDFGLVDRAAKHEGGPAFKLLFNAIEDGYVEARRGLLFHGSRYNLAKKNEWFWSTGLDDNPSVQDRLRDPEMSPWTKFIVALSLCLRPYGGRTVEEIEAVDPKTGRQLRAIWPAVERIPQLAGETKQSEECYAAAEKVWAAIKPPKKNEDEQVTQMRVALLAAGGGDIALERFMQDQHSIPLNPEEAMQQAIRRVFEQPDDVRPYIVFDPSFDIERDFSGEFTDTLSKAYARYLEEATKITDDLAATFEAALYAKREKRLVFSGDEEGEIDVPLLAEYALGSAEAEELWLDYKGEEEGDRADVAILIDCSGSMGNGPASKSYLARLCAIACHEALKRAQVPHEISGFTTVRASNVAQHAWAQNREAQYVKHFDELRKVAIEAHDRGTDLPQFARTCNGDPHVEDLQVPFYGIFKGWSSDEGRGLALVAGLDCNLDGEAILWQARRLARRSGRRKTMIVLSDGYPAGSHDNAQGARYLSDAVKRVLECGIEVYGIGVMSEAVREFYPHWWVCRDLRELPSIMVRALLETVVHTGTQAWTEGLR